MDGCNTSFLLGGPIFRDYVSFGEGRWFQPIWKSNKKKSPPFIGSQVTVDFGDPKTTACNFLGGGPKARYCVQAERKTPSHDWSKHLESETSSWGNVKAPKNSWPATKKNNNKKEPSNKDQHAPYLHTSRDSQHLNLTSLKTAVMLLFSINWKPLKPAIQLPKKTWYTRISQVILVCQVISLAMTSRIPRNRWRSPSQTWEKQIARNGFGWKFNWVFPKIGYPKMDDL